MHRQLAQVQYGQEWIDAVVSPKHLYLLSLDFLCVIVTLRSIPFHISLQFINIRLQQLQFIAHSLPINTKWYKE